MNARVVPLAVLCGLCVLIPLPLLDGWVERRITRNIYAGVAKDHGMEIEPGALHVLTQDRSSILMGCLYSVFIWPIKKLFSTIFFLLVVKQVIDGVANALHRAEMIRHALAEGLLPPGEGQAVEAERVRTAMDTVFATVSTSPVGRGFRRQPAPPHVDPAGKDPLVRVAVSVHRFGGGRFVTEKFAEVVAKR